MNTATDNFMPILFKVLFAFVIVNMIINFILLFTKKLRIYKLLAFYWPSVLMVFILQSIFQTGNLEVTLAYSVSFFSMSIFAMIGFEVLGRKFPLKNYIYFYLSTVPVTIALHFAGLGFTTVAMPFAIGTAAPLFHTFYLIHVKDRKKSTRLQKVLGVIYFIMVIHCINFAVFRMDPGAQLWGWLVAYAIYDTMGILLPSIALEEANMSENERLQKLVDERTKELNKSLAENENLLKVVLHDISSPLMTMKFYLSYMKPENFNQETLDKANRSQAAIEKIILDTKNRYATKNNSKNHLEPVGIDDCFNEVRLIFGPKLEKKNISLVFNNQLAPQTKVLADQTTLTHSVLSNLVSNGLKFSYPNSVIQVSAKEINNNIVLEIKDQGPGIPKEVLENLNNNIQHSSSIGTAGEVGTGFGLSIVKSFVDSYGGQIEFDSKLRLTNPQEHGTNIRITLDRA